MAITRCSDWWTQVWCVLTYPNRDVLRLVAAPSILRLLETYEPRYGIRCNLSSAWAVSSRNRWQFGRYILYTGHANPDIRRAFAEFQDTDSPSKACLSSLHPRLSIANRDRQSVQR